MVTLGEVVVKSENSCFSFLTSFGHDQLQWFITLFRITVGCPFLWRYLVHTSGTVEYFKSSLYILNTLNEVEEEA